MKNNRLKMPVWLATFGLVFSFLILSVTAIKGQGSIEMFGSGEVEKQEVDYYLPYPGMLPDNPFYWVKMMRDRMQLWLSPSPLKKAEKLLLYADKRLGAGYSLIDGGKESLGITTLTKGEKYLERAKSSTLKIEGEDGFKEKLGKATRKHSEVLKMIKTKVGDEEKKIVDRMIEMNSQKQEVTNQGYKLVIDDGVVITELEELEAETALELLTKGAKTKEIEVVVKKYDFGSLVESIGGKANSAEKAWIYFLNGESATQGADQYKLVDGDVIEWKYIKPIF